MQSASQKLSKSARRRQQLVRRGEKLALCPPSSQQQSLQPRQSARNRRPKGRGRKRGRGRVGNPYLMSLMYPQQNIGARIPDLTGIPTSALQVEYEITLTTNANGLAGILIAPQLYANPIIIMDPASTNAAITWQAGVAFPYQTQYSGAYSHYRCVSGEICIDYIGTSNNDSGLTTAMWLPRGATYPTSVTDAAAKNYSETAPLKLGSSVLYRPMDNYDVEFGQINFAKALGVPLIGMVCSGAWPSTANLRVRAFFNFECIPFTDQMDLANATPSPINRDYLEQAFQWAQTTTDKIRTLIPYAQSIATVGMNAYSWYQGNMGNGGRGRVGGGPTITSIDY